MAAQLKFLQDGSWIDYLDTIYPVGAIYQSSQPTSPATLFGGTWSQLTDGRFLRPSSSWRDLGGSNSHIHWQTLGFYGPDGATLYAGSGAGITNTRVVNNGYAFISNKNSIDIGGGHVHVVTNSGNRREDATYSSSNLPAYSTCYTWYRTA